MKNEQEKFWQGAFGNNYIQRNKFQKINDFNNFYISRYGQTRNKINLKALKGVNRKKAVLEVGCNIGNQLIALDNIGFKNLYGIDINKKSLLEAKKNTNINFLEASGFDIPFKDNFFNLVFTNNVLIHIQPNNLNKIFDELYRVSGKFIMGFEYYNKNITNIKYRNYSNKLWKGDYCNLLLKRFPNLKLVREQIYKCYDEEKNINDKLFLLKKN
jgi:pseudaminic acid biosynthesis-associated methylase